jgi:hypothetical protein
VRSVLPWIVTLALASAAGCKNQSADSGATKAGTAGAADEVTARISRLQEEEGDVLSRRDELTRARQQVDADRRALDEKRKQVAAQGGDSKAVDEEERALSAREAKLSADESELNKKIDTLLTAYQQIPTVAAGSPAEGMARRESQVASREKDFARRETGLAQREASLAQRERDLAKREKEMCSAVPTTIVQQVPTALPGARYSRHDVDAVLSAARRKMNEKGLLGSDLPVTAKGLEREATDAMAHGDWSKAKLAADQLYATVDSVRLDRSFIQAKINRLNGVVRSSHLAEETVKQVDELFRDATADYGDGRFSAANGKLNRIFALLP